MMRIIIAMARPKIRVARRRLIRGVMSVEAANLVPILEA
jgi:hypothetical protein